MSDSGVRLRGFIAELKRRRVFRVAVLYAVISFGVLQVADIAFPALKLPDWSITFVVALALLGFPIALVLAYAFDITRHGVVRTEPLADETTPHGRAGRRPALIAVALVSLLTVAAGYYILPKLPGWWSVSAAGAERPDARKLLVVLPFVNLGAPADEYFAEGITEEITARLATVPGLGVIARTTAIQYKDTEKTVAEIGTDLGVDYVLEGTVRWEAVPDGPSRVRVTPQLIKAADATHVWAEIYEEPIASVFQVQSEIAEKVVGALGLTLVEPDRLALQSEPTGNLEAYSYYLLGNDILRSSTSQAGSQQALEMFERAIELDPGFDLARKKIAEAHANVYWGNFRTLIGFPQDDVDRVLDRISPETFGDDSAAYFLAKATLLRRADRRADEQAYFDSARAFLEPEVVARPTDARRHAQLGLAYAGLGRRDEAEREGARAVELAPIAEDAYTGGALADNLAHIYVLTGKGQAAIDQLAELLSAQGPLSSAWLRVDPTWEPLRGEARFQDLLEADT